MTINKVHDFIQFILRKERAGSVSHEEIDMALDKASLWYFNFLIGNLQELRPGQPLTSKGYAANQRIYDELAPFKVKYTFTPLVIDADGVMNLPNNYLNAIALFVVRVTSKTIHVPVPVLTEDKLAYRLSSHILEPSEDFPVATIINGKIQFYPASKPSGYLWYFKRPVTPVYAYTVSGHTESYNSGSSTQLEWSDLSINNVMFKAIEYLGVNLDDGARTQYSQSTINAGT